MTALSHALGDSATMVARQLLHMRRYPSMTLTLMGMPIVFMLLFVYVFGGAMGAGGAVGNRADYANYIAPGILLITVASAAQGTAISVAMDMTEGIVARFRTMAIARVSVLTGHVVGSLIQAMLTVAAVTAVALLVGFRPSAGPAEWLAALGLLAAVSFALTWFSVALGLVAKTVESASNLPLPLVFLPFLGSGFVPTETLPAGIRWFAEYQPFTPIIETLRGLLTGTEIGSSGIQALAWCAAIALASYLWARKLYNRDPSGS
ncbi:ABC transporter permease [Nocardiopsis metallicus]|uniref:Transport permease protein n=1 Tax=Nocardiopsis metallicus TaxID=179819 RepID=A0A840WE76_9ACTN|nr:ABC transporter permease [Nocardiopsis metallicus]MBB5494512.1 ABC-2 type transport system permease protein [Nocardiopsis metallicus]